MNIKREDLDRRAVDFSDVATGRRLPPIHPGEILRDEFLRPLGLSVYRLARSLKISRPRLNDIVLGRRGVTIDTALRLGRYFGTTPEFWINLQARHDLDVAEQALRSEIEREIEPHTTRADLASLSRAGAA
ncbi:MAG: HigA family addiction module antitoxin [Bryobacterales bacterium]|nr:HigA family addiction module antitoxin [Bryobacterales bacterium]